MNRRLYAILCFTFSLFFGIRAIITTFLTVTSESIVVASVLSVLGTFLIFANIFLIRYSYKKYLVER